MEPIFLGQMLLGECLPLAFSMFQALIAAVQSLVAIAGPEHEENPHELAIDGHTDAIRELDHTTTEFVMMLPWLVRYILQILQRAALLGEI